MSSQGNPKAKKPPLSVSDLGGTPTVEHEQGAIDYVGKVPVKDTPKDNPPSSGAFGKLNITQIIVSSVLSIVLALAIANTLFATKGSVAEMETVVERGVAAATSSTQKQVDSVNTRIDKLDLGEYAKRSELTAFATTADVDSKLTSWWANNHKKEFDALKSEVDKLTDGGSSSGGGTVEDETRWNFRDVQLLDVSSENITAYIEDIDPSRIEEEGLYDIELTIENNGDVPIPVSTRIELVLVPRDDCVVDEDETYIDSDDFPFLTWDTDFVIRTRQDEDVCRRMTATSKKYNFGTLEGNSWITLDLVLELVYLAD